MIFPTTNWTTLAEATLSGGVAERKALGEICEKYYEPVERVIRARGVAEDRVEDVRQDFFLGLMEGGFFRKAEKERGKFRSFLLNALRNYLVDDLRKMMASKRGGGLQREELREDMVVSEGDDARFDLAWAEALFQSAMKTVGEEIEKKRGEEGWELLRGFLTGSVEAVSYLELSSSLGITEGAAKAEVSRVRKKFRDQLRTEIKQTVTAPHEIDEELTYLRQVMQQAWAATSS